MTSKRRPPIRTGVIEADGNGTHLEITYEVMSMDLALRLADEGMTGAEIAAEFMGLIRSMVVIDEDQGTRVPVEPKFFGGEFARAAVLMSPKGLTAK